jgi:hypothetical protein
MMEFMSRISKADGSRPVSPRGLSRRRLLVSTLSAIGVGIACWLPLLAEDRELAAFALRLVRTMGLTELLGTGASPKSSLDNKGLSTIVSEMLSVEENDWRRFALLADGELREHIRANIVSDFHRGDIVHFQGWRLSATEHHALTLSRLVNDSTWFAKLIRP